MNEQDIQPPVHPVVDVMPIKKPASPHRKPLIVLIIVLIILVIVGGWYVWKKHHAMTAVATPASRADGLEALAAQSAPVTTPVDTRGAALDTMQKSSGKVAVPADDRLQGLDALSN